MEFRSIQTTIKIVYMIILVATIVLLQAQGTQCENHISLNKTMTNDGLQIECGSNSEITFQFLGEHSNATTYIATCEVLIKSCYLVYTENNGNYNIMRSSGSPCGGVLKINQLQEDVCGTYRCCETYNPSICSNSTTVVLKDAPTTIATTWAVVEQDSVSTHNPLTTCKSRKPETSASPSWLLISLAVIMAVFVLVFAINTLYIVRRFRRLEGYKHSSKELDTFI